MTTDRLGELLALATATGDKVRGQSLVVRGIHEGRNTVRSVDRYLMYGETYLLKPGARFTAPIHPPDKPSLVIKAGWSSCGFIILKV